VNFGGALLTVPAELKGSSSKNDNASETVTRVTDFGDITIDFGTFPAFRKRGIVLEDRPLDARLLRSPQTKSVSKYYMEVLKGSGGRK